MSEPRKCFYIPADAYVEGKGFVPSVVTEGEPGHAPLTGNGAFAEPWYWGDYEAAKAHAALENARLGLTAEDVAKIVASSMFPEPDSYHVAWEIDALDAESPADAARQCREMLLDPANIASVFVVTDSAGTKSIIDALTGEAPARTTDKTLDRIYSKLKWDVDPDANDANELNADELKAVQLIDSVDTLTSLAATCGSDDLEQQITDDVDRNDLDIDVTNVDWVKVLARFQNT